MPQHDCFYKAAIKAVAVRSIMAVIRRMPVPPAAGA